MVILGAGTIAQKMASTIRMMSSVEPYAIAARDKERAKAFAVLHGFPKNMDYTSQCSLMMPLIWFILLYLIPTISNI
jgi:predicted dehydrogenase